MYYDSHGRPDPNGDFEMVNGKQVLRDGRSIRFNVSLIDGKPAASGTSQVFLRDTPAQITDAQITTFRDSAEGRELVAYAKSKHALNASRGGQWTADMERAVIADALTPKSHPRDGMILSDAAMAAAQTEEHMAYLRSVDALNRK